MTAFFNDHFYQEWRYAVAQEFTDAKGNPFQYARNGNQAWGDELKKLPYRRGYPMGNACVSADGKYLAIVSWSDIYIIDTQTLQEVIVLKGHISMVCSVAFKPDDSDILASCELGGDREGLMKPAVTYIWSISEQVKHYVDSLEEDVLGKVGRGAAERAAEEFKAQGMELAESEIKELGNYFHP